jgi:UDP-glucose:(heptosyl)LPS alpha-1,3-glucosyltransferase
MRIVLVSRYFSETLGGVERFGLNLARQLIQKGHQVDVFAHTREVKPEGVAFHPVPMNSLFSWSKMISFSGNARSLVKNHDCDIVYTLSPVAFGDIFRMGGLHKQWLTAKHPWRFARFLRSILSPANLANLYLEKRMFAGNTFLLFVANSRMGKEHIILHYGIPADRIRVVYNGVDVEVFHDGVREQWRDTVRRQYGIPADVPLFLFLASNWKRKGLDNLLRALPTEPECRLLVVGSKRWRRAAPLLRRYGLTEKVILAGPTAEPWRFYAAADLFVLPTRCDPFANVCLEALACGLPVVTTRENGASELIRHGQNGYVVDHPDDLHGLREILLEFLGRKDWDEMRHAAAETGCRYSSAQTAETTLSVFNEVLAWKKRERASPLSAGCSVPGVPKEPDRMGIPPGWREIRHSGQACVLAAQLEDGRNAVYKEFLPRNCLERWKTRFRGSRAERARRGSAILRSKGFSAPQTLRTGRLSDARSYILSEALPGETLEDYYKARFDPERNAPDPKRKRDLLREFGRTVGKLHRAGIVHGDLRGFNVLVEETEAGWRFHFLDNERTVLSRRARRRFRNLVQIATIILPGLTNTDRMRFFHAYLSVWPELLPEGKEWAKKIHTMATSRLKERGLIP